MATPHIAGVIALLQGTTERTLTPDEIKAALLDTAALPSDATDDQNTRFGHGIVNAAAALEEAGSFGTLEGSVTDRVTDAPIAEATVTAEADDGTVFETATDSRGRYELAGLEGDREYSVTVAASHYNETTGPAFVPADETATRNVSLAGDSELEVVVDDAHFGGVTEATVTATGRLGTYSATHEGDGVYLLDGVPSRGEYAVNVSGEGYVDTNVSMGFGPGDPTSERVALVGDTTIEVTVLDENDEPLENATVTVERPDGTSFEATGRTDADGDLTVTVPGDGTAYTVRAAADEYQTNAETTAAVSSGTTESVSVGLSPVDDGLSGFGVMVAVVAVIALSVARARR